jgi:isoleucyl-tRNA synthetase
VYWSPSSISALAEAELEYVDDHKSQAVYVAFPVQVCSSPLERILPGGSGTPELLIWTTTPWTLPSNMAVTVNAELVYCIVHRQDGRLLIVAKARVEDLANTGVFGDGWSIRGEVSGRLPYTILVSCVY